MKAIGHRVHFQKLEIAKESKEGGIIIAHAEGGKPEERAQQYGIITDIGPDSWKEFRFVTEAGREFNGRPWCKIGDIVFIQRYSGHPVNDLDTGKEYTVINDIDVLAVVKPAEEYTKVPRLVLTKDGVMFDNEQR